MEEIRFQCFPSEKPGFQSFSLLSLSSSLSMKPKRLSPLQEDLRLDHSQKHHLELWGLDLQVAFEAVVAYGDSIYEMATASPYKT